jgi:threonylcarbamoyladenosine tRNA methylthiotransferase MtaB
MAKYVLKTLGCKANLYDSQALEQELQQKGWSPFLKGGEESAEIELCVINSCSVTDEADRQTRKLAAKLARENPKAVVVVTGCAAEIDPEGIARQKGVHFVVGNQNKTDFVDLVLKKIEENAPNVGAHILSNPPPLGKGELLGTVSSYQQLISRHPVDREWPALADSFRTPPSQLEGHSAKTRAFLKIQEGCDSFCTYCIIPYGRGPARSLSIELLLGQIRELIRNGIREVILTGTNIGDYGRDWAGQPQLENLISEILANTPVERLRVSSLDPTEITPGIFRLMQQNSRFCPHFHVSLQSPHSRILKLMKRKYSFAEVEECLFKIQALHTPSNTGTIGGVFVGMDVITGFPGETDEEFEWTYEQLARLPWSRLHVFPYSERKGTPATRLPGSVPQHKRTQRARRLNELSLQRLKETYQKVLESCVQGGLNLEGVLLERADSAGWTSGYTPNYLRVLLNDSVAGNRNQIISVRPVDLMVDSTSCDVALVCSVMN